MAGAASTRTMHLVRGALEVLRPLYAGRECAGAGAGEREAAPKHVLAGPRRFDYAHDQRHRHCAVGYPGQGDGPARRATAGRPLSRDACSPYASLLMDEPAPLRAHLEEIKAQGFRAFKMGWGPFGRVSAEMDEEIVRTAREAVGEDAWLMVDAGGSDAYWTNGYKWALRTAHMLADYDVYWFEEPLSPDALEDYVQLRRAAPVPISGGEVLTRRQSFQPWLQAGAFDIVQPDVTKVGGISEERRIALDGAGEWRALHPARLEHGRRPGRGSALVVGLPGHGSGGVHHGFALPGRT